jgi:hypothetical protein
MSIIPNAPPREQQLDQGGGVYFLFNYYFLQKDTERALRIPCAL